MRHHATILTRVWTDPDFLALSAGAKGTYLMLVSQERLSMVGVIDYLPDRWASYSAGSSRESIEADIAELEAARFVIVDRATFELAVRTTAKNDPPKNPNSAVGMWKAWAHVLSRTIRRALVDEMPPIMWADDRAPTEALAMRDETPAHNSCGTVGETVSEQLPEHMEEPSENLSAVCPLPPSTIHHPPSTIHSLPLASFDGPDPDPSPVAPVGAERQSKPRERNLIWDALTDAFGEAQTRTEQKLRGQVARSLASAGATPAEIATRVIEHRRRWPGVSCTETSLEKHWTKLGEVREPMTHRERMAARRAAGQ